MNKQIFILYSMTSKVIKGHIMLLCLKSTFTLIYFLFKIKSFVIMIIFQNLELPYYGQL